MDFKCIVFCLVVAVALAAHNDPLSDKDHYHGGDEEHDAKYDHDAFLGKDGAEEFDDLSPEQSKAKLSVLVPKIDKDGDGEITEQELQDHINFMQKRYVANDVERTWKQYDAEHVADNKLDWKTYRAVIYGPEEEGKEVEEDYARMIARDEKRWKVADVDKDGKMNKEEYGCFMHPEDCDHMRDVVVEETLADIDKNGDGVVTMDEYIGDMYRPDDYPELEGKEPDWVASEREMFTTTRDKDGDGKLNKEEMTEWIMPSGFDHAEAEARHLIHMADDDKDMKLSLDEILNHYDVFVGSQATDYGEQLQKHDPSEL